MTRISIYRAAKILTQLNVDDFRDTSSYWLRLDMFDAILQKYEFTTLILFIDAYNLFLNELSIGLRDAIYNNDNIQAMIYVNYIHETLSRVENYLRNHSFTAQVSPFSFKITSPFYNYNVIELVIYSDNKTYQLIKERINLFADNVQQRRRLHPAIDKISILNFKALIQTIQVIEIATVTHRFVLQYNQK